MRPACRSREAATSELSTSRMVCWRRSAALAALCLVVHDQCRGEVLEHVVRQTCAKTRGPYYWRETEQRRKAAALLAGGMSARAVSHITGANRRSIARWLRRAEFLSLIEAANSNRALARGALRRNGLGPR